MLVLDGLHDAVRSLFEHHETALRLRKGPQELIELALRRCLLATLGVLDHHHHDQGHGRCADLHAGDPSRWKAEQGAQDGRAHEDAQDRHGSTR